MNVVSSNIPQNDEALIGASTYMQQIKGPAMNLIKLYLLHCTCTFSYIYSLAIVGNVLVFMNKLSSVVEINIVSNSQGKEWQQNYEKTCLPK